MRYLLPLIFLLTGCDNVASTITQSEVTTLRATCKLSGFDGFPEKVTGPVTIELKSFITILVESKDKKEKIEITFPKSRCGVN